MCTPYTYKAKDNLM